ncbi:serine protease inhibitor 42Dd-like isoform X2 [Scaptodrosophila lebanonensis]|uniref:Serine protease inhibitor 42Dd-like isoform X2 n=1 Tax=Drosophila lebanonensis TaxID=7225 RepID=A0A6J2UGD1_DROLE|nr:serine protease inhibitor 42Dd-like isoform X2 [Scaptodrosophila lebanonensis]
MAQPSSKSRRHVWLLVLTAVTSYPHIMANTEFAKNLDTFSRNVYSELVQLNQNTNIIFSPFSIQTCAAMVRIGAEGETATEMDVGLKLVSSDVKEIADTYGQVMADYEKSKVLKIANKVYIKEGYSAREEFKNILTRKFLSKPENINFVQSSVAASTINAWVESKTNNLIKDLISPDVLNADTRLVLINAIHFKGQWKTKFDEANTEDEDFYLNDVDKVKMPMMNVRHDFRFAELPEYDAQALEMPYKDSDLSMLVILPNKKTGLLSLEQKLKTVKLSDITSKLSSTKVIVKFPKFKAEFSQELTPVFKKLGMVRLFADNAEFGNILQSPEALKVSQIIHKAFIDVNEEGTEAAAATAIVVMQITSTRFNVPPKRFIANRPFYFVIKNSNNVPFFAGKMLRP